MTFTQLHYAVTIAEQGSFNRASEILYVSQPSLTDAIRSLETELGITIFRRGGRGVSLTADGEEFMTYAREAIWPFERLREKYSRSGALKKKFGVSTQHYSFAVKSFVEMVKQFDTSEYEFALRETKTKEVISDVASARSEIGILYLNDFNRKAIEKLLRTGELDFHPLTVCDPYVYLWKGHPLAGRREIRFADLADYPCLSFEQGDGASFYLAEEILSTAEYPRTIKANDRATMLNLMIGLNGYTLCSGIICEELNGSDYLAVPFRPESGNSEGRMEIGYLLKKNRIPSRMAELFIEEMKRYLSGNRA